MSKKKHVVLITVVVLVIAVLGGILYYKDQESRSVPEFVLTYAENQAEDYPTTLAAQRFAEMVYEQTDGKVEIRIRPNSILGDEYSVIEQIRFGGIDFCRASLSTLAEVVPKLNVLQLPYLYEDSEHMWEVLDGEIGAELLEEFDGSGMVALSWYDAGARSFYTSQQPIRKPEDLKGLRIRVPESELMADLLRAMGAEPVVLAFDEVYSSLVTGTIDGAENNWPSYESLHHNEVAPYFTVDEHMRVPECQVVSQQTWDKLPEEYQQIIRECARESAEYERSLWKEQEEYAHAAVLESGTKEIILTEKEKKAFEEAAQPIYEKYASEYMDLVEGIRALRKDS